MNKETFLLRSKIRSVFKMHFEENYYYSNSPKMDEINGSIRHLDKLFKEAIGKGTALVDYVGAKNDVKLNRA